MKVNLIYGLTKLLVGKEYNVYFAKKCQPFASPDEGLIVLNFLPGATDASFVAHIKNRHGYGRAQKISTELWTALHEVGHTKTCDFVEYDGETRYALELAQKFGGDLEKINNLYYELEDEWAATEWAIQFVKKHYRLCRLISKF